MSNRSIIEKELTQGVVPIGVPKAYQYDQAIVESAVATVQQGLADIASATNDGETSISNLGNTIINQIKAGYGYPFTASTSAGMTDHTKIYVYTGTTGGGFTQGNWYYWNGSAWTSGGVYNSTALETDTTLSVSGMAGDSKTIGDKFKATVIGGATNINDSTKGDICGGDIHGIPVNTIYAVASGTTLTNLPYSGTTKVSNTVILSPSTLREQRTGQVQLLVDSTDMYFSIRGTSDWSNWIRVGTDSLLANYLQTGIGSFDSATYDNELTNIRDSVCGFIIPADFEDSPVKSTAQSLFMVVPSTNIFATQILIPTNRGNINLYTRLIYRNTGNIFSDWKAIGSYDCRNILAIGDSICRGDRNNKLGFVGGLGIPYVNAGVSGATLASGTGHTWIEQELVDRTETSFDAILMQGGVNDYNNDVPLGTLSAVPVRTTDTTEYNALDTTTVIGAMEHLFVTLQSKYPNIDKFFIISHKIRNWAFTKNYTGGYTQEEMHDAMVECCELYNVQVIDIYRESPINTYFPEYVSPTDWADDHSVTNLYWVNSDQVHPLNYGYIHGYLPFIQKALRGSSHKG